MNLLKKVALLAYIVDSGYYSKVKGSVKKEDCKMMKVEEK